MKVELTTVTPDYAAALLANNTHNRTLNRNRASSLAAMMRSGEWQLNGETIIVSETGKLLDGQHRLKAVMLFGQPVDMIVASGAPDNAFQTIDTGKTRSASDILTMSSIKNPTAIAASSKLVWQMMHGVPMTTPVPPAYIMKIADRFPAIAKYAAKTNGKGVATIIPQTALIAAMVYLEDIAGKPAAAREFYNGVVDGANLGEGSPILALRNRIIKARASGVYVASNFAWPITTRAISHFEAGQKVRHLKLDKTSGAAEVPTLFPVHIESLTPSQRLVDLLPPELKVKK